MSDLTRAPLDTSVAGLYVVLVVALLLLILVELVLVLTVVFVLVVLLLVMMPASRAAYKNPQLVHTASPDIMVMMSLVFIQCYTSI